MSVLRSLLFMFLISPFVASAQGDMVMTAMNGSSVSTPGLSSDLDEEALPIWKIKFDSAQLLWKSDINASIVLLKSAERIAFNDLGIYDENYLTILNELGLAFGEVKNFKKADEYLRKTISLQGELFASNDPRVLKSQCNLATVMLKAGEDIVAKSIYKDILWKSSEVEAGSIYTIAAENLSKLYEVHDQYDSALIISENALQAHFNKSDIQNIYELKLDKGRVLRKDRRYVEASRVLTELEKEIAGPNNVSHPLLNSVRVELSLINIELRLFVKAEKDLLQLYRTIKSTPRADETLLTELTNGLGYIYEKLGVFDKALVYYRESLNRCITAYGFNSLNCVIMQNNIAGIYLRQGMVKEAIVEYEEFVKSFNNVSKENNRTYLTALNNLATAYRQNGQYELALGQLNELYVILENNDLLQDDVAAAAMNNMAVTYALLGDMPNATRFFEKVLCIKEDLYGSESPALLDIVGNLAVTYWVVKRHSEALPLFKRSLDLAMRQVKYIFPSLTAAEQVQFYQQQKQNFERFNTLSIQSVDTQPELLIHMFNNQLLLKSLVFFTGKKQAALIEEKGNDHLKSLSDLIETESARLGQYYQMPVSQLQTLGVSLEKIEFRLDSLEKIIRHSIHSESQGNQNFVWEDARRSLNNDEALIEIVRFRKYDAFTTTSSFNSKALSIGFTDSVHYAALITTSATKDFPRLVLLRNGNQLEKRFLAYYRNTIKFDIDDTVSYSRYFRPFIPALDGRKKIYISADGVYHQLNLNAVHDKNGKFILEEYEIHPIMNAGQLVDRDEPKPIDFSRMMLFGNPAFALATSGDENELSLPRETYEPLPGTLAEVKGIMNIFQLPALNDRVLIDRVASETNFRKLRSPSILHVATHGFFSTNVVYLNEQARDDHMFHSGIILAPGNQAQGSASDHDGVVTAYDVMNMDFANTSLVVISGCETGLGKIESSEGVYGLQRSFLQAGAKEVVVSLWKVEDATTKNLMIKFYLYMNKRHTSRESFRMAQLDMLHEVHNPRLWAGFTMLSGD